MKNFLSWHYLKEKLHKRNIDTVYFEEREIWWCSLGVNVGYEQDGKNEQFERPVVVIRKFSAHLVWVVPLSTQIKRGNYFFSIIHNDKEYTALLLQMRPVSTKRLLRKIRKISPKEFDHIRDAIRSLVS